MARDFVDQFDVTFEVVTDPGRETYRLAGMQRGMKLGLDVLKAGVRAFKRGHVQGRTKGDAFQQGGVLVVGTNGELLFAHADGGPGDHVEPDQVLEVLRAAAGSASSPSG